MENNALISVRDLTIGHDGKVLCSGISFDIFAGDCIMLCGANGSGKTTLMKHLAGPECIMIPARIPKVAGFTLREFVRVSCFSKSDLYGKLSPAEEEALEKAIATLGLTHLADRDISTLSDGEFQKAGIASALVRKADIIMLDEPTAFLDAENRISVLNTLKSICDGYPHSQNTQKTGASQNTQNTEACHNDQSTGAIHNAHSTSVYHNTEVSHRPAIVFSTHDLHDGLQVCTKVFALGADRNFHCSPDSTPESKAATVSSIFSR
jgi:iron complex transport system ATP-binding protein